MERSKKKENENERRIARRICGISSGSGSGSGKGRPGKLTKAHTNMLAGRLEWRKTSPTAFTIEILHPADGGH